jgi:hypothetical protein
MFGVVDEPKVSETGGQRARPGQRGRRDHRIAPRIDARQITVRTVIGLNPDAALAHRHISKRLPRLPTMTDPCLNTTRSGFDSRERRIAAEEPHRVVTQRYRASIEPCCTIGG